MMVRTTQRRRMGALLIACLVAMVVTDAVAQPNHSRGRRGRGEERVDHAPAVGEEAPNFKLKSRDGKLEVELASFRGKKHVALIFGSYT